jgi:hypothetical protein
LKQEKPRRNNEAWKEIPGKMRTTWIKPKRNAIEEKGVS